MDEASTARPRRGLIAAAVVAGVALVAIVVVALVASTGSDSGGDTPTRGSAARAIARLDANRGAAYAGDLGDASDPATLRRAVRAELRSDDARPASGSDGRARHCADLLRGSSANRGRVVLLADATMASAPAVVVGIADHGRVVVFVADATTCDVRTAQSL